jgi:hypothetical protein
MSVSRKRPSSSRGILLTAVIHNHRTARSSSHSDAPAPVPAPAARSVGR